MELITTIRNLSLKYHKEIVSVRRHLHANPELSLEEYYTSEFIASKLKEYKIPFKRGIAKTGIVAIIEGKNPSKKVVALRADMDALPITEKNDVEYKSRKEGVMHACGHDIHVASLLGTAKILKELANQFEGTVKLIFQPSEERYPGGAIMMIKEGVLKDPAPQSILAQHVLPSIEAGKIGMKSDKYMASTDEIFIIVKGKGGHAATPELNINPIPIASTIILELHKAIEKENKKKIPTVIAFGKVVANGKNNIIPDDVFIEGTFRTYNEEWREAAHKKITETAKSIAKTMKGNCEVIINRGYPFLVNDKNLTKKAFKYAVEYLGKENVVNLDLRMTAEDFAYFAQKIPGCLYRLGIKNEAKGIVSNLHTPTFDADEKCLETGMGLMAWMAVNELR